MGTNDSSVIKIGDIMKSTLIALLVVFSAAGFAKVISGEALLKYTPYINNTGDIFVYNEVADALFDELKVDVIRSDDFDAKYGDGIACFKFSSQKHECRIEVKFRRP